MRRKSDRKLLLHKETLHSITGGMQTSRGSYCNQCSANPTFCGGCPKVTQDWPSCGATYCGQCMTDRC